MRPKTLCIVFGEHKNSSLEFDIVDNALADLWIERMERRHQWPLDDPKRFYNFGTPEQSRAHAESMIRHCIDIINQYQPIIERGFTSVEDQDMLNYLHNIFEKYHGMLDQQQGEFWDGASQEVRQALAQLNIAVHRCEAVRGTNPRFVCTWWGMPKTQHLPLDLQKTHGKVGAEFGSVYLNYCEIGKTLRDLAYDDDHYVSDEMFKPFDYYSADFSVTFWDDGADTIQQESSRLDRYFHQHETFFRSHGVLSRQDPRAQPLRFKVAQLRYDSRSRSSIIKDMADNQFISEIMLE